MKEETKRFLNEGIDLVGGAVISLLPADGAIKNALKFGLDKATDLVFDPAEGKAVPLREHSELKALASNLVPIITSLVDSKVLKPLDLPFVEGENELLFEKGLLLQIEALLNQAIVNYFVNEVNG